VVNLHRHTLVIMAASWARAGSSQNMAGVSVARARATAKQQGH
jgi:hypothetical protein